MALNLTPDYFEADRKYRQARTTEEKLAALEEMLRTIPKHKASEKKQSELKRRISDLRHAGETRKKGATVDPYHIERQGGGQVLLVGLPNSGKSSIVGALTKAPVKVTDFPYGTALPTPGIAFHEDAPIELVDLPPVTPEHVPPGMINALRNTDAIMIVGSLASPSVLEDVEAVLGILREHEITFGSDTGDEEEMRVGPPGLIVCTHLDVEGAPETLGVLRDLRTPPPELLAVSATTGENLDVMMRTLFGMLDVIRVYSKRPGQPADKEKPFILPVGTTVEELARHIHKEIAEKLKFARVWGGSAFSGQQVHGKHVLADRDVVELHT